MINILACALSVLQFASLSFASPLITDVDPITQNVDGTELIDATLFNTLSLYEQYSAAAYCRQNFDPRFRQTKLVCLSNNCPLVQDANTTITLQLNK
jgi:hypothetical protein